MSNQTLYRIKAGPVFWATKKAIEAGYPVIVNEGGSRSGKSYGIMQLLIYMADTTEKLRITVCSHSLPHVKKGVYRDFMGIMKEWDLWNESQFSYTDFVYKFGNGSYIELIGLEDPSKAHGPGRDILFINEANLVTKSLYEQLAMRTTGISITTNSTDVPCGIKSPCCGWLLPVGMRAL